MGLGQDFVGCFGPDEWVAAFVPAVDERADGGLEVFDGVERSSADRMPGDDVSKKISTMLSQDPDVGVKCVVIRGLRASQAFTLGCLCVA